MKYKLLFILSTLLCTQELVAQVNHELLKKPDTLSVFERLQVSTNMIDWALLFPNIGVEYDLGGGNLEPMGSGPEGSRQLADQA